MTIEKVLLVAGEESLRKELQSQLGKTCEVRATGDLASAHQALGEETFDLILTEAELPDGPGIELLDSQRNRSCRPPVALITSAGSLDSAVEGLRLGAIGFLLKPVSPRQIEVVFQQAAAHWSHVRAMSHLANAGTPELLGRCAAIEQLRASLRKVARTDATVLIQGEPGTGKELVARTIHRLSERADAPFIHVDCASLNEQTIEAGLFGSSSGPIGTDGLFALARGGTLWLEEVSLLSAAAQGKLLRALESQERSAAGPRADVRLVVTTSRDLAVRMKRGDFSEELFHALSIVPLALPTLRERGDDLALLAGAFRQHFARKHGRDIVALSPAATAALRICAWPGNISELRNAIERAVLACTGSVLEPEHLDFTLAGERIPAPPARDDVPEELFEAEKRHIFMVLARCKDNRTHAARRLGISLRTLRNKLREYRLATAGVAKQPQPAQEVAA